MRVYFGGLEQTTCANFVRLFYENIHYFILVFPHDQKYDKSLSLSHTHKLFFPPLLLLSISNSLSLLLNISHFFPCLLFYFLLLLPLSICLSPSLTSLFLVHSPNLIYCSKKFPTAQSTSNSPNFLFFQ